MPMKKDDLIHARWRWEFLRRGDAYKRAYQRFAKKYGDRICLDDPSWLASESIKRGEDPRVPIRGSFINKLSEDLAKFRKTWRIDPTDPASPLSPFLNENTLWLVDHGWENLPNVIAIRVCIDLRGPESEIMDKLRWRVYHAQEEEERHKKEVAKHKHANSKPSSKPRKRFKNYPDYLCAFDLKKERKTDAEIAAIMFPGQYIGANRILEYRNKARYLTSEVEKGNW